MRTFKIFEHPVSGLQAVKVGFSWPAFFFGFIWMLVSRLWVHALVVLGISIALAVIIPDELAALSLVISLGMWIFFGINGNQWRVSNLLSRGFTEVGAFEAENKDMALRAFHEGQQKAA